MKGHRMLLHPTLDLLNTLGLSGMAKGLQDLESHPEARSLDHAEWLGLLLDQEVTVRRQKRFENRARSARLRHDASVEDVDYQAPRGLDRGLFLKLGSCDWIRSRRNLLITGPCGVGKSYLACALGQKVPRDNQGLFRTFGAAGIHGGIERVHRVGITNSDGGCACIPDHYWRCFRRR